MKLFASAVAIALTMVSSIALAKSVTIKIEIAGMGLAEPLEITDPEVLRQFNIWNGPGVSTSGARSGATPGAFIDWSKGTISKPEHAKVYTVTFHQGGRPDMHEWHRTYVVSYAPTADQNAGYIYLPGPSDGEVYGRNVFSIVHGVEGNWFRATADWQKSVLSLLQRALD